MGETTVFSCDSCGYRTAEIRWGAGSVDPRIRFLPALCRRCREIVEIDLTGRDILIETFTCPACSGQVAFFDQAQTFVCPRCGAPDLRLKQCNYW